MIYKVVPKCLVKMFYIFLMNKILFLISVSNDFYVLKLIEIRENENKIMFFRNFSSLLQS
jgi:hypothetical protein